MTSRVYCTNIVERLGIIPQSRSAVVGFAVVLFMISTVSAATAPPVVDSLTADPQTVQPGGLVNLQVEAHDPDCNDVCDASSPCGSHIREDLTYWTSDDGTFVDENAGVAGSPYSASAVWQAPDTEGSYTLTVGLADNGGFFCGGRATTEASITVVVSLVTSEPPVIHSVTANPSLVFPDEQSQIACSATDPEGEGVTYTWAATNGVVAPAADGAAIFTAGDPGVATVTCTATDPAGAASSDSVNLSVTGAEAEKTLAPGLATPQRVDITSWGDLYVADRATGGLTAVNLFSGELVHRLPVPNVTSVAVTWNDDLLVAGGETAAVMTRRGDVLLTLDPGELLGKISDVAVDATNRVYGVLYRKTARVVLFNEGGSVVGAFGSTGTGNNQFMSPNGLAAAPDGSWLVGDTGNGQIKRFDAAGSLLATYGERGAGIGEFMQLDDVAVDGDGVIYASDSYQDWVVSFNPDGSLRDSMGTYGDGLGELKTASGVVPADAYNRVVVASLNGSSLQVFKTTRIPVTDGPAPNPSLSDAVLGFASQMVGTVSASQTVSLTNDGDAPLGIRGIEIGPDFRHGSTCPPFLDPGQSCSIPVSFAPTRPGAITGAMTIDTSAAGETVVVDLSGIGATPPAVVLSPSALVFDAVQVGNTSAPQTLVLSNAGTENLVITAIEITGDFARTTTCGGTLAGGASCAIEVVFAPQTAGDAITGALTVSSNAPGSPHGVPLEGVGLPPDAALSISSEITVTEGDGDPAVAVFTVTIAGQTPDTVTVDYVTEPRSADEDEDYLPVSGTLEFPSGVTERTIEVVIADDEILEPARETFLVRLENPVNADLDVSRGYGRILDDELCPSPNLLFNPDAEERLVDGAIPGWTVVEGEWRLEGYDPLPVEGAKSFAAGSADVNELQQSVDVSLFAATIDADSQEFAFEAYLRTAENDTARVVVEYVDTNGNLLDVFSPGTVSAVSAWTRVADFRVAPPLTRFIRVRLIGQRLSGDTADAFFDHIALVSLRVPTLWVDDVTVYEGDFGELRDISIEARAACRYFEAIRGRIWTSDGTAIDGEDYLGADELFELVPGETETSVSVTILGDDANEFHEHFDLNLSLDPGPAVTPFGPAQGTVFNDDFCPQAPLYWIGNPDSWPVDYLFIGGYDLDQVTLLWLLEYTGPDVSHQLASELTAAKLNVEAGSEPSILDTIEAADAFLVRFPPGTHPTGQDKQVARDLIDVLEVYNRALCTMPRHVSTRQTPCDPCGGQG